MLDGRDGCLQACRAYNVEVRKLDGSTESVSVEEDTTMLEAMLDAGMDPSHDCKMGVCMTCPARLVRIYSVLTAAVGLAYIITLTLCACGYHLMQTAVRAHASCYEGDHCMLVAADTLMNAQLDSEAVVSMSSEKACHDIAACGAYPAQSCTHPCHPALLLNHKHGNHRVRAKSRTACQKLQYVLQISGEVDQENAMLSEEVQQKGYALMCVSTPKSDCVIQEITEEEILDQAMV